MKKLRVPLANRAHKIFSPEIGAKTTFCYLYHNFLSTLPTFTTDREGFVISQLADLARASSVTSLFADICGSHHRLLFSSVIHFYVKTLRTICNLWVQRCNYSCYLLLIPLFFVPVYILLSSWKYVSCFMIPRIQLISAGWTEKSLYLSRSSDSNTQSLCSVVNSCLSNSIDPSFCKSSYFLGGPRSVLI